MVMAGVGRVGGVGLLGDAFKLVTQGDDLPLKVAEQVSLPVHFNNKLY